MSEDIKKLYDKIDGKSFNDFDGSLKTWGRYTITCFGCGEIMSTGTNTIDNPNFCNKCLERK